MNSRAIIKSGLIGLSILFNAGIHFAANAAAPNQPDGRQGTQLQVSVTIIDPCESSQNLNMMRCQNSHFTRMTESLERLRVQPVVGEATVSTPVETFIVRTIDFY